MVFNCVLFFLEVESSAKATNDASKQNKTSDDDVGGMFKIASELKTVTSNQDDDVNARDCSRFPIEVLQDWSLQEVIT